MNILKQIPKGIWALGIVSLFMDASSELIHSLLPIFMVSTLGASATSVGIIEGAAEATALITKIFSGTISDYFGKRKLLTVIGYGLAAITKPLFPLASNLSLVVTARFIDRIGKGIRGAPRDALMGEIAPKEIRGACFGLRQSMDTVGAFIGPILAMLFMVWFSGDIRLVLWIAVVPAFVAVAVLVFGVNEPTSNQQAKKIKTPIRWREIRNIGKPYWQLVTFAGVLTLARFSEAFLILKAQAIGLPVAMVPLVLVLMNVVYAAASYPAGKYSDGKNRYSVLLVGILFLIVADIILAMAGNIWILGLGVSLWGLHMGLTQGVFAALIIDTTPAELRGTAFGIFNFISGIAMLLASVIAGLLWDHYGSAATFCAGAIFAVFAFYMAVFRSGNQLGK